MSVKAMSLVWDMECPTTVNGLAFESHHKYVLVAYADHADHSGRNIYPAVETIRKKTGYKSDRSVQKITHELRIMGLLIHDGMGPRGTNRHRIPFSADGSRIEPTPAIIAPPQKLHPAIHDKSLGESASGAFASGAIIAPELKEPEPNQINNIYNNMVLIWDQAKTQIGNQLKRAQFDTWVKPTEASNFDGQTLHVVAANPYACQWLEENIKSNVEQILGVYVNFTISEMEEV